MLHDIGNYIPLTNQLLGLYFLNIVLVTDVQLMFICSFDTKTYFSNILKNLMCLKEITEINDSSCDKQSWWWDLQSPSYCREN
jgi:hypothetical protein